MKRFILSAFFAIVTFNAVSKDAGYEKWFDLGLGLDVKHSEANITLKFTNGYRFNNFIFLGGGLGIGKYIYTDELIRIENESGGYAEIDSEASFAAPIYATFKTYFVHNKVAPFFVLNTGYVIGKNDSESIITSGFFFNPNIGLDININRDFTRSIFVLLGVNIQQNKNMLTWDLDDGARAKIQLSAGFRF